VSCVPLAIGKGLGRRDMTGQLAAPVGAVSAHVHCPSVSSTQSTATSAPKYTLSQFKTVDDLGAGSFGVVKRVVNQDTNETFAMKVLDKQNVVQRGMEEQLKREVLLQLSLKHSNVVRLHYYFEDSSRIYCLLEYADKGQLFAYLRKFNSGVPESRAAHFFADTVHGVDYLHHLNIAHRDLKPENILLYGEDYLAKLGDLGWCVEITDDMPLRKTFCGTLDYLAPEMLTNDGHDITVDLWALGVLLYEMLLARAPFATASKKDSMDRICAIQYEVPKGVVSKGPEELIHRLLLKNKRSRIRTSVILSHPWVQSLGGSLEERHEQTLEATRPMVRRDIQAAINQGNSAKASALEATRPVSRKDLAPPAALHNCGAPASKPQQEPNEPMDTDPQMPMLIPAEHEPAEGNSGINSVMDSLGGMMAMLGIGFGGLTKAAGDSSDKPCNVDGDCSVEDMRIALDEIDARFSGMPRPSRLCATQGARSRIDEKLEANERNDNKCNSEFCIQGSEVRNLPRAKRRVRREGGSTWSHASDGV